MKIQITFKTPDAAELAIAEAIEDIIDEEARMEARLRAEQLVAKFVRHGEYATIELDTETGNARVLRMT